ncbi:unnamed protein product, partial [Laminaria digitata]
ATTTATATGTATAPAPAPAPAPQVGAGRYYTSQWGEGGQPGGGGGGGGGGKELAAPKNSADASIQGATGGNDTGATVLTGSQGRMVPEGRDASELPAETPDSEAYESKTPAEEASTPIPVDGNDPAAEAKPAVVSEVPVVVSVENPPGGQAAATQVNKLNGEGTAVTDAQQQQTPGDADSDASVQVPSRGQQQLADDDGESGAINIAKKADTIVACVPDSGLRSDPSGDAEKESPEVPSQGSGPSPITDAVVVVGKTASSGGQPNEQPG